MKINNANLQFRNKLTPINRSGVTKLVQHHMAHPSWGIKDVHNFHKNSNGWNGIGYNWWIDFKGNVYEGRGFNVGAHVKGYNSTTIGIGYQGDFTKQTMPDAQLKAGVALNKWLIGELRNVSKDDIIGHRDLASTTCPGPNFRMGELRKAVGGSGKVTVTKPSPSKKPSKPTQSSYRSVSGNWTGQTLVQGVKGNPVKQLQTKLANNNPPFYPNKGAKNNGIDSYYGSDTANSVKRFQSYYGLTVDSKAGKQVYAKLGGKSSTTANLKIDGYLGESSIKALQRYYNTPVDGKFSKPSLVVKKLQATIGTKVDGYFEKNSIRALQRHFGTPQDGILSKPSLVIKKLQSALNNGKI